MFKSIIIFFLALTFGLLLESFKIADRNNTSVVAWLNGQEFDFGTLRVGKPVHCVFKFKNISADTLLLETTRTTCGCTAASYTETPIPPSQEGSVTVEYDAEKTGFFEKKIKVFFDRQKKAEVLVIRGEVN